MVEALKKDYRTAPISEQDRTMLDYVVKLTKGATECGPEDHARLRAVGFDDRGKVKLSMRQVDQQTGEDLGARRPEPAKAMP